MLWLNRLRLVGAAFALVFVGGLGACNTIEGAGEDIERAGQAIDSTAEDASN